MNILGYFSSPQSFNNRLVVESYTKGQIRTKEVNGFASIVQKSNLQGLKVLMNARLTDGTQISKGSVAYVKEETLHTQQWAQKAYEADTVEGKFLIVDMVYVEFIVPPKGE